MLPTGVSQHYQNILTAAYRRLENILNQRIRFHDEVIAVTKLVWPVAPTCQDFRNVLPTVQRSLYSSKTALWQWDISRKNAHNM